MATGDIADMAWRIFAVLPQRWFPALETAPVLNGLLTGVGAAWTFCFSLLGYARSQARILTATGAFLDMIAADFFGLSISRRAQENDSGFKSRILASLLPEQGTRKGVSSSVVATTGGSVAIFEPGRPADTGGYGALSAPESGGGVGYGVQGLGYGSLQLPFAFLVTVTRPKPTINLLQVGGYASLTPGVAMRSSGGYGIGALEYVEEASLEGVISDDDIRDAVLSALPVNTTAWLALQ